MERFTRLAALVVVALLWLALSACRPGPTAVAPPGVALVAPSATPSPAVAAATPTTPVLAAPATPTPVATQTAVPATATSSATATPAETATPTPTPSPTPLVPCFAEPAPASVAPFQVVPGPWPRPAAAADLVFAAAPGARLIHLGFDVEGSPQYLGQLLDILDKHQVKTTMFILGSWGEVYPNWVVEFARRGHELANHTYTHANMRELSPESVRTELEQTEALVQQLTGQSTKPWFRPPFGSRSDESLAATLEGGWTTVIWTGGTEDWREGSTEQTMCNYLADATYPGAILYSHTYHAAVPGAVDHFIGQLQSAGYTFVPLSVLLAPNASAYLLPR